MDKENRNINQVTSHIDIVEVEEKLIPNSVDQEEIDSEQNNSKNVSEESDKSSYRQIFKATSLFGGVQVFNILIGVVRVKFIAVLLGAAGVGIIGLFNTPLQMIITITGLGIAFGAIRDVSDANAKGDDIKISKIIRILKRCAWITGIFGTLVTLALAPMLSEWSFGNKDYTWAFVWLSITLLLNALSESHKAILQGSRMLKELAKAGFLGSALGLATSIPLYYFYGVEGIMPSIILAGATVFILNWYFSRKIKVRKVELTNKEVWNKGFSMAKLGVSMTLAGFIGSVSIYVLNAFISNVGGLEHVGLYNAGWGVVGQYTGVVFTAMATDYFPRLSAIQDDNLKISKLVSQQAETALLIMSPLLALLIVTMPIVVRVLYTPEFLPIVMFANLTVLGMQFKAVSWAMGYVFLAKGDGKLFLILEIISGVIILSLNLIFYYLLGLNGLGISFIFSFLFGGGIAFAVLRSKYKFNFPKDFYGKFLITYGFVVLSFLTVFIPNVIGKYAAGIAVLMVTALYSYYKLNELMDLKQLVVEKIKKRIK